MIFVYNIKDILAVIILGLAVAFILYDHLKKFFCKHKKTTTSQVTLDEYCSRCGKNLGFTGRKK